MASGLGVKGTMGRCYGFFADLKQCQVRKFDRSIPYFLTKPIQEDGREALRLAGTPDAKEFKSCRGHREDYFECLHQKKTHARIQTVLNEELKQKSGAKGH